MNGNMQQPSVPIITFAGLTNLSNVLRELPLPSPIEPRGKNKSLLFNPRVADEARRVLATADPNIVSQMAHVLRQSNTDHIQLKDGFTHDTIQGEMPETVRVLLAQYPDALNRPALPPSNGHPAPQGYVQQYDAHGQLIYPQHQAMQQNNYPINQSQQGTAAYANSPHYSITSVTQQPQQQQYNSPHSSQSSSHYDASAVPATTQQYPTDQNSYYQPQQQPSSHTPQHTGSMTPHRNMTPQHSSGNMTPGRYPHGVVPSETGPASYGPSSVQGDPSTRSDQTVLKESVIALQPLSAEEIDKYIGGGSSTSHAATSSESQSKPIQNDPITRMMPSVRLKKLDVGSSYAVADLDASGGLKLKLKKADGSSRLQDKRKHETGDDDDVPRKKKKKHKHHKEYKSLRREEHNVTNDYEAVYNVKYLITVIDAVLDSCSVEDLALAASGDPSAGVSPDVLVSRTLLTDLANEAAKLKDMSSGSPNNIPADKLSRLMTILQWNVQDGCKLLPPLGQTEDGDQEQALWRDLTMDRVLRSLDAAQASLYLMTSANMPKVVYLEDLIELIADMVKFQLMNNIYPEFDPVYRNSKDKEYTSSKMKRSRASGGTKNKTVTLMFNRLCEIINNLTDLVAMQPLTDTAILKISALGVQPFFVENVSELQLGAIMLVTEVFSSYDKHRQLIIEDIFSSLANLPTSKRNLRTYRLSHEEHIQMVTALVLQLIQCIVRLPEKREAGDEEEDGCDDVLIVTSYEQAMKTAHHFLSVFLKKCAQKGDEDYRPLFDNFVNDLLVTSNKPEWPAAELMLSLLGRLLVQQFSNKQVDMALRVASLDYLGTVAARLRKDALCTQQTDIDDIMETMSDSSGEEEAGDSDVTQKLQLMLLHYLLSNGQKESALINARSFYLGQWYRDITVQAEKSAAKQAEADPTDVEELERANQVQTASEKKKKVLLDEVNKSTKSGRSARLSYSDASAVTKFLTSQRPFSQSFDVYLAQILKVLSETAVAVRTKAMKCLTLVVEADPGILARPDLRQGVHARFLDQSTQVREACVELVGKFILSRPDLIAQYYEMIAARILDTGISVRKRVIKIFRDVCVEAPNFDKIPDMCVKMIRRVNDEDGIKKLVTEVFQTMWFTPVRDKDSDRLMRRVLNITTVVSAIRDSSYEFIEHLMKTLLDKESELSNKPMIQACKQIVDTLVQNVLKLEQKAVEVSDGKVATSRDLISSLATLHLFSKVRPDLMVEHADTLQPYLEIKCSNAADNMVLHHTSRILELVIPLIEYPREAFLAQVEEDLMTLVLRQGMTVVQSALSCLGAVINQVTHNYTLVKDCFKKFQNIVFNCHKEHQSNPKSPALQSRKAALRRSLFTIGVLCMHFDFDSEQMDMKTSVSKSIEDLVFEQLMYFVWHEEEVVRNQALTALGFYNIRYYTAMLGTRVKDLYHRLLIGKDISTDMRVQVLNNLGKYLQEEEEKMAKADGEWKKNKDTENLKEMGDVQSGMASTIMQVYLKQVLEAFFNSQIQVRSAACNVLNLILKQGLIHPVQCVPYLVAMSADCDSNVRIKSDQHLIDIDKKHPGFIHMKAMAGMKMSYRLHRLIQQDMYQPLRGIRNEESPQSLNHHLYSIIRTNRSHRRALLTNLLNLFDDTSKTLLGELVYMADNLAFFPYQAADEPLYIMHHIDILVSVSGSNILQAFKEGLLRKDGQPQTRDQQIFPQYDPITGELIPQTPPPQPAPLDDDEEDEEPETLYTRLPEDCSTLQEHIITAQGCVLLLLLKQHLKDMYNITDSKLNKYSPNDSQKVWEKPINRKLGITFLPKQALDMLREGSPAMDTLSSDGKMKLIDDYLAFKHQMHLVDPADDDEDEGKPALNTSATAADTSAAEPAADASVEYAPGDPGYADPEQEITSMPVDGADAYMSMQPTISIVPMSMTDMPPEMAAQLQASNVKSKSHKSSKKRREDESGSSDDDDYY